MGHVTSNVGGVYEHYKTFDQEGAVYTPVPKAKQQKAVRFVNSQIFQTPQWLIDNNILGRVEGSGTVERIRNLQSGTLSRLFDKDRLHRIMEGEALHGSKAFKLSDLFQDIEGGIWGELKNPSQSIDHYRRNLQRVYIEKMRDLLLLEGDKYDQSDIKAYARASLRNLEELTLKALAENKTGSEKAVHLEDILDRVRKVLDDPNKGKGKA